MKKEKMTKLFGYAAAFCTTGMLIPQLIKTVSTKQVQGLSIWTFIACDIGLALWLIYGFRKRDGPLIWSNIISLLISLAETICIVIYNT